MNVHVRIIEIPVSWQWKLQILRVRIYGWTCGAGI